MTPLNLLLLLLLLSPLRHSASAVIEKLCGNGIYSANDTYATNLKLLLSSLTHSSTNSSFSTATEGSSPDPVFGLFLCRGDGTPSTCHTCVQTATIDSLRLCPSTKRVTVWHDACQVRYSDLSFFSTFGHNPFMTNKPGATDPQKSGYGKVLVSSVSYHAAYNSSIMFATGKLFLYRLDQPAMYGMAQCTRDLSEDMCNQCLQTLLELYLKVDGPQVRARALSTSCNFGYDERKFFEGEAIISLGPLASSAPQPLPSPDLVGDGNNGKGKKRSVTRTLLVIISPPTLVFILIIFICFWKKKSKKNLASLAILEKISYVESLLLDLATIKAATADFSPEQKLGEGGFGSVYKGILPDGQEIAVKRLSLSSSQGIGELKNELVLVAKLQHKNLVRLLGVCLEKQEKLLVYEYVPNRSLDTFLFDPIQQKQLNWETRFKIIGGISQGLHYLHEESHVTVIHRDVKASNILLDADMNPKISDFGLSKLFGYEEKECTTRRVVGTLGYMAPEYATRGQYSMKSDVYSFGILLLEIITGRKRSKFHDCENYSDLVSYTWEHWTKGTALEILDPSVKQKFSENEVLICIQIGLLCIQEVPAERPLMSSVLLMLYSPAVAIPAPSQPTLSVRTSMLACTPASCNNASISELEPR